MLFHTAIFAGFFALVWVLFWSLRAYDSPRVVLLTFASWGFYAAWDWRFLGLLVLSTIVDYSAGRAMAAATSTAVRRRWMALSAVFNLGVLATFKYLDFFASSAAVVLRSIGLDADWVTLELVLPVGISFYTFQTLGYSIDVYLGRAEAERDPWRFAAYVAFFPQLVAGPIERASQLIPQLAASPTFALDDQVEGARRFLVGYWKKAILADNLGAYVDWVFATPADELRPYQLVLGVLAFAGQIWGDFAGYTDMAIGVARTLGIRLQENFDAPYFSSGPSDFWRRWHMSLSTWLRDYLYIPLGGNRRGPVRTQVNLMITMVLGGLWHGAAWTFVAWGAFHGVWLAIDRGWARLMGRAAKDEATPSHIVWQSLRVLATFALVCFGWLLFRAPSMAWAMTAVARGVHDPLAEWSPAAWIDTRYVLHFFWPVLVLQATTRFIEPAVARSSPTDSSHHGRVLFYLRWAIAAFAVMSILLEPHPDADAPFIYFQF